MTQAFRVTALPMGDLTFPPDGAYPGQTVVVVAYAVRHDDGVFLFDTGFREAAEDDDAELRAFFEKYALRTRPLLEALDEAGIDRAEVTAVANCHLHFDHSGQNALFPDVPISKKPLEVRMGSGKGNVEYWVAKVKPGKVLFEMEGVTEVDAREAFRLAGSKLSVSTSFVKRQVR